MNGSATSGRPFFRIFSMAVLGLFLLPDRLQAETAVELLPCFALEEGEEECPAGREATQRLGEENPDCELSEVEFEGKLNGECCYDFTADNCYEYRTGCIW
jgi:hypothetical protein